MVAEKTPDTTDNQAENPDGILNADRDLIIAAVDEENNNIKAPESVYRTDTAKQAVEEILKDAL